MLPPANKHGRLPAERRRVMNAVPYVLKCGVLWRLSPRSCPPWKTVHHVFGAWSKAHMWAALNDARRVGGWLPQLRKLWAVERTFGWLMRHRRLVRDCERTEAGAESWISLAKIRIQLRRLA